MDIATIRINAAKIHKTKNLDKAIFYVDSKEKLHRISRFNILGRFVHWCRGEEDKAKVHKAFKDTISGIEHLCDPQLHSADTLAKNYSDNSENSHYVFVIAHIFSSKKYGHLASDDIIKKVEGFRRKSKLLNSPVDRV